jgi:hypothetical protein
MGPIFYKGVWLGWFSMRMGFVVVYSIGGIRGIVSYGIGFGMFFSMELGILSGPGALLLPRYLRLSLIFIVVVLHKLTTSVACVTIHMPHI